MKHLLITLIVIIQCSIVSNAENYTNYYRLINKAEEKFVLKRDKTCFTEYDAAFKDYKPFLKDAYIASQIAIYLGDTLRFYDYLKICFQNDMPITAVNSSELIRKINHDKIGLEISTLFKTNHQTKKIDEAVYDKICLMCYQSDSIKVKIGGRDPIFYNNEDKSRKYILDNFLAQGIFPNEMLLGITTDKGYTDFYKKFNRENVYAAPSFAMNISQFEEFELRLKCPYNIILHSKCFYATHRELFRNAMLNGYIHPKEIGILEEVAILWHNNAENNPNEICESPTYKICYNIFPKVPGKSEQIFDDSEAGIKVVEENRKKIHMQKYSVDTQKKILEKETGIKFFFDFLDR